MGHYVIVGAPAESCFGEFIEITSEDDCEAAATFFGVSFGRGENLSSADRALGCWTYKDSDPSGTRKFYYNPDAITGVNYRNTNVELVCQEYGKST